MASSQPGVVCVNDWADSLVPPTIRRPWRVFEEDLEDKLQECLSQADQDRSEAKEARLELSAVQAKGAKAAFMSLPQDKQRHYAEVSLLELSAYVCWRRAQVARQKMSGDMPVATELEAGWEALDIDDKAEWLPEDPRGVLAADGMWAGLLVDGPPVCDRNDPAPDTTGGVVVKKLPVLKAELPAKVPLKGEPAEPPQEQIVLATETPFATESIGEGLAEEALRKLRDAQACPPPPVPITDVPRNKDKARSVAIEASAASDETPAAELKTAIRPVAVDKENVANGLTNTRRHPPRSCRAAPKAVIQKQRKSSRGLKASLKRSQRKEHQSSQEVEDAEEEHASSEGEAADGTDAIVAAEESAVETKVRSSQKRTLATMKGKKLVAENIFPEALEATCCKCGGGEATDENDIGICDRCDKAFHQRCHDPPVRFFGHPDDQWFCSSCTSELAKMRELSLKVGSFAWVQGPSDSSPWPAQVLRIDFASLADPKPYWVQFFDTGPPQGIWAGEAHVKAWEDGPSFSSIREARRRLAVRLAEGAGATRISDDSTGNSIVQRTLPQKRVMTRAAAPTRLAPASQRPRRASVDTEDVLPKQRRVRRRVVEEEEEDNEEASKMTQQVDEMRRLIAEAQERQKRMEEEILASQAQ